jgi:hypothetical protein
MFSPNTGIPVTTAAMLQRNTLFLSGFNYQIGIHIQVLYDIECKKINGIFTTDIAL